MSESIEAEFLDQLFTSLRNDQLILPTLPEVAIKIQKIVDDPDSSLSSVAKIISHDPALSARLISVANSPLLRGTSTIGTVDMAVMRMGANMVKNIVTSMVMEQLFKANSAVSDRKLRACWKHSSEVSSIAVSMCEDIRHLKADQAMLAGLIHNIGVLPVITLAESYPSLLLDEPMLDKLIAESHATIGTAILDHWNFAEDLVRIPALYNDLTHDEGDKPDYIDLIIVANMRSSAMEEEYHKIEDLSMIPAFEKLGIFEDVEVLDFLSEAG